MDKHNEKVNQINNSTIYFNIYHQNIRGLWKKACELLSHLHPDLFYVWQNIFKVFTNEEVHIQNYNLGAYYCRHICEKSGVAIFVHNSLHFLHTDIYKHCEEKDIKICVLKRLFSILNICVLTLYTAPSGNFRHFLLILDNILQFFYTHTLHIICGDIKINCLLESEKKNQLDNLLLSYNLTNIIHFPTRVQNTSATATDNIFIDIFQFYS